MIDKLKQLFNFRKTVEPTVFEKIDNMFSELGGDTLSVKLGDDLVSFGQDICDIVSKIRDEMSEETGFVIPSVHVFNDKSLQENEYAIQIHEEDMFHGFAIPNKDGIDEISLKLKETILDNIDKVLTNEITEKYIDTAQKNNGWLIWALSYRLSSPEIKIILSDILKSGHSIKNINYIFERIGDEVFVNNKYYSSNPHKISKEIIKEL